MNSPSWNQNLEKVEWLIEGDLSKETNIVKHFIKKDFFSALKFQYFIFNFYIPTLFLKTAARIPATTCKIRMNIKIAAYWKKIRISIYLIIH